MKACMVALPLLFAACCAVGRAQAVKPSITIGSHVLTLGTPESSVLEQLGADLHIYPLGKSPNLLWVVQRDNGPEHEVVGEVAFEADHLSFPARIWQVEDNSSKALFYAIDNVEQDLERGGLTRCGLSAKDTDQIVQGGSVSTKLVTLNCGVKRIEITLVVWNAPKPGSNTEVLESIGAWMKKP